MPASMCSCATTWRLSGDEIILNRKHTTRLNVAAELTKAFDRYKDGALVLQRNIEDLKAGPLSLGGRPAQTLRDVLSAAAADPDAHSRHRQLPFHSRPHRLGPAQCLHPARQEPPPKRQYPGTRPVRPLFRTWERSTPMPAKQQMTKAAVQAHDHDTMPAMAHSRVRRLCE